MLHQSLFILYDRYLKFVYYLSNSCSETAETVFHKTHAETWFSDPLQYSSSSFLSLTITGELSSLSVFCLPDKEQTNKHIHLFAIFFPMFLYVIFLLLQILGVLNAAHHIRLYSFYLEKSFYHMKFCGGHLFLWA